MPDSIHDRRSCTNIIDKRALPLSGKDEEIQLVGGSDATPAAATRGCLTTGARCQGGCASRSTRRSCSGPISTWGWTSSTARPGGWSCLACRALRQNASTGSLRAFRPASAPPWARWRCGCGSTRLGGGARWRGGGHPTPVPNPPRVRGDSAQLEAAGPHS
jgi:hypothetical protein